MTRIVAALVLGLGACTVEIHTERAPADAGADAVDAEPILHCLPIACTDDAPCQGHKCDPDHGCCRGPCITDGDCLDGYGCEQSRCVVVAP